MQKTQPLFLAFLFVLNCQLSSQIALGFQQIAPAESNVEADNKKSVARDEIMKTARRYAKHRWVAESKHVFHGKDINGNQVDTPDKAYRSGGFTVGAENVGIPYQWGGFSSIEEFDQGISENRFAGHLPKNGAAQASPQAVGVDCSGFVSRCWDLPRKHSTRSLGNICYFLDSYSDLKPGDIINSFDGHVVIFDSFADEDRTKVVVYEAGGTKVQRNVYPVSRLEKRNFKPLRYKPLDTRWSEQSLAPASFKTTGNRHGHFEPDGKDPIPFEEIPNPFSSAVKGNWVLYDLGTDTRTRLSVSAVGSDEIVIRNQFSRDNKFQLNERSSPVNDSLLDSIIDVGGFDQDFGDLKLKNAKVESGYFQLNEQQFDGHRLLLEIDTSLLIRGTTYPVIVKVDCFVSDEIPIAGIIHSRYDVTVQRNGQVMGRSKKEMKLLEFFRGSSLFRR